MTELNSASAHGLMDTPRDPLQCLAIVHNTLDHRDFAAVSHQLAAGYARIVELGLPASTIAAAMLGATLNFYDAFDLSQDLPGMLRAVADAVEFKIRPS